MAGAITHLCQALLHQQDNRSCTIHRFGSTLLSRAVFCLLKDFVKCFWMPNNLKNRSFQVDSHLDFLDKWSLFIAGEPQNTCNVTPMVCRVHGMGNATLCAHLASFLDICLTVPEVMCCILNFASHQSLTEAVHVLNNFKSSLEVNFLYLTSGTQDLKMLLCYLKLKHTPKPKPVIFKVGL